MKKHQVWKIDRETNVPKLILETDDDSEILIHIGEVMGHEPEQVYAYRINQKVIPNG